MRQYYPYPKAMSKLVESPDVASYELPFILWVFLKEAGYPAEMVLLGESIDTPIAPELFNIKNFVHAYVRVTDGNEIKYIHPSEYEKYSSIGLIGGRWILPLNENGSAIEKLEHLDGNYTYIVPQYICKLNVDGTLELEYKEIYNGPIGGDKYRYHKNDKPRELSNFFEEMVKSIDPMANLVHFNLKGHKSLEEDVVIEYGMKIPAFAVRAGEEILAFKLPTVAFPTFETSAVERTLPFSKPGNTYSEKYIEIELPEGYEIEFISENEKLSVGYRSFIADLKVEGNKIFYTQIRKGENEPLLKVDKYSEYKEFVEDMSKFGESWILIKKKS
jgi:hypothetical protein